MNGLNLTVNALIVLVSGLQRVSQQQQLNNSHIEREIKSRSYAMYIQLTVTFEREIKSRSYACIYMVYMDEFGKGSSMCYSVSFPNSVNKLGKVCVIDIT